MIGIGRDEGLKFSLGSDGHHPGQMHYGGPEQIEELERLLWSIGLREPDICIEYAPRLERV
jgi:hypothetical protein